jgi:hypothetical protein
MVVERGGESMLAVFSSGNPSESSHLIDTIVRLEDPTILHASLGIILLLLLLLLTEEVPDRIEASVSIKSGAQTGLDIKTTEASGGDRRPCNRHQCW